jgi:hypothetical protein
MMKGSSFSTLQHEKILYRSNSNSAVLPPELGSWDGMTSEGRAGLQKATGTLPGVSGFQFGGISGPWLWVQS